MMHACSVNDKQCFKSSRKPTEHHMQMPLILRVVLENKLWTKKMFPNLTSCGHSLRLVLHRRTHCLLFIDWMTSVTFWCLWRQLEEHLLFVLELFSIPVGWYFRFICVHTQNNFKIFTVSSVCNAIVSTTDTQSDSNSALWGYESNQLLLILTFNICSLFKQNNLRTMQLLLVFQKHYTLQTWYGGKLVGPRELDDSSRWLHLASVNLSKISFILTRYQEKSKYSQRWSLAASLPHLCWLTLCVSVCTNNKVQNAISEFKISQISPSVSNIPPSGPELMSGTCLMLYVRRLPL